jgi:hypothetical protein
MSSQNVQITGGYSGTNGTLPGGAVNIQLSIGGARGGGGGFDGGGPGGSNGNGRTGVFSIPTSSSNRSFSLLPGTQGATGPGGTGAAVGGNGGSVVGNGDGGKGGDDGTSGWSGCGGGGGACSYFYLNGSVAVNAGGGGGGGGGSLNRAGGNASTAGGWSTGGVSAGNGGAGGNKGGGDGGGGGGGGGGHTGGGGGGAGEDNSFGGGGGGGGTSRYNNGLVSISSQGENGGQGYAILYYTIIIAEVNSFTISPSSIIAGVTQATLSWSVSDSTSQSINQGIGAVGVSGSTTINPPTSRTYTITAIGSGGNDSASASITVYQPVVAQFISASPNPITVGQSSTLTWVVTGSANTPATINQGVGNVLFSSAKSVSPSSSTTYTLAASGPGGSDSDQITVVVYQIPQLSYSTPVNIDYGDSVTFDVTYRYATGGVNGTALYSITNPATGATFTSIQNISLPGTTSDESGAAVTSSVTLNIPWSSYGVFGIALSLTASGGGGSVNIPKYINVIVDQLPDSINIPNNMGETPSDDVEAPDFETVLSDPITITDIDVAVEITANEPIQVRFDDDDPDIEANWNNVRPI